MQNLYYSKRNQHANNVTSWKENRLSKLSSIYVLVQPEIGMECILLLFSCYFLLLIAHLKQFNTFWLGRIYVWSPAIT